VDLRGGDGQPDEVVEASEEEESRRRGSDAASLQNSIQRGASPPQTASMLRRAYDVLAQETGEASGDDTSIVGRRLERGLAAEEVEQVDAAAEDAVAGDEEHGVAREAGRAGQVAPVEERHEDRRAADGGAREPARAVGVGGPGTPALRPQRAARRLQRRRGDGQVERGAEARPAAPVRDPGPGRQSQRQHRTEVRREREPELGFRARELRVGQPRENGHAVRAEVGEHGARHTVEGVKTVAWRRGRRRVARCGARR
jgi:hypothetical protein